MKRVHNRLGPFLLLAICVGAALYFRTFAYVAWYPVIMSAAVALSFGLSLRTKPLCEAVAERMPPGILPPGGKAYARSLTKIWCALLVFNGLIATGTVFAPRWVWVAWNCAASYLFLWGFAGLEWYYRRQHFAVTFQTSGSTGNPKKIRKPFETLAREVAFHRAQFAARGLWERKPVFLTTVEPEHMYGMLWRVLLPQDAGCECINETIRTPEALLAYMRAVDKVFLVTTPSFLAHFTAYAAQYDVPQNCVEIITSGALLTAEVSAAARRTFGITPLEIFGSTETGGVASRRQEKPDALWELFPSVRARTDENGRLCVTSSYSVPRTYRMGDGVRFAEDGRHFTLLGRQDRLAKINEQRIDLVACEAALCKLEGVREVALVVLPGKRGDILGAVLALDPAFTQPATAPALFWRGRMLPLFPSGAAPKRFRVVPELPRNAQGKVQTAALRALFEEVPVGEKICTDCS